MGMKHQTLTFAPTLAFTLTRLQRRTTTHATASEPLDSQR